MHLPIVSALLPLLVCVSASPVTPADPTSVSAPVPTTSTTPDGVPCPGIDCYTYLVGEISPWLPGGAGKPDLLWDPAWVYLFLLACFFVALLWGEWNGRRKIADGVCVSSEGICGYCKRVCEWDGTGSTCPA